MIPVLRFSSDTDSVMAVVIDIAPSPLENRCFFKLMREIVEHLDTGNLSHDREDGDPIFRTTDDDEYERLKDLQIRQKACLGKIKIETPGKFRR